MSRGSGELGQQLRLLPSHLAHVDFVEDDHLRVQARGRWHIAEMVEREVEIKDPKTGEVTKKKEIVSSTDRMQK